MLWSDKVLSLVVSIDPVFTEMSCSVQLGCDLSGNTAADRWHQVVLHVQVKSLSARRMISQWGKKVVLIDLKHCITVTVLNYNFNLDCICQSLCLTHIQCCGASTQDFHWLYTCVYSEVKNFIWYMTMFPCCCVF